MWPSPFSRARASSRLLAGLRALPFGASLDLSQPGEIRARTLVIFDRSFAVTYLLEAVAIVIGLFGVAATFSAQTLARAREFGMLRHVGVTRSQVLAILALEGGMLTACGIAMGFVLGFAISLILVFVVNPQSFHWSMSLHVPWTASGHRRVGDARFVVFDGGDGGTWRGVGGCGARGEGGLVMRALSRESARGVMRAGGAAFARRRRILPRPARTYAADRTRRVGEDRDLRQRDAARDAMRGATCSRIRDASTTLRPRLHRWLRWHAV